MSCMPQEGGLSAAALRGLVRVGERGSTASRPRLKSDALVGL